MSLFSKITNTYPHTLDVDEDLRQYDDFKNTYSHLKTEYTKPSLVFNTKIIKGEDITVVDITNIADLDSKCLTFRQKIDDYYEIYLENN
ncbi:hypothetical protein [Bacillus cereus]|uniref:hypothetical protein n=1 Tax=Bacillus cereus TaxID=1396 RepID=UPI00187A087C|nr:hypothetical protein [Bacillus cereus]